MVVNDVSPPTESAHMTDQGRVPKPSSATAVPGRAGPHISGPEILVRAYSWLRPSVPFDPNSMHSNEYGAYRTNSAGYVAMAWWLPEDWCSGVNVADLVGISSVVEKNEIGPGDVLLRGTGTPSTDHAAIFEAWLDESRTTFWGLEQRRGLGAIRRRIRYPYENSSRYYRPHRYDNRAA